MSAHTAETKTTPPRQTIVQRLRAQRLQHPELHTAMVPDLRILAERLTPEYRARLRADSGCPKARPLFLTSDAALLQEAADEIEHLRKLCAEAAAMLERVLVDG